MSLRKRFMKRLRALGIEYTVDSDGALRVPARHASVGDLIASFENAEISVFIGEITHCHFTPGSCGEIDSADSIEECVSSAGRYVRDVLADKYVLWTAGGGVAGVGGSYHVEHPIDTPTPRASSFLWSGPITE